MSVLALDKVDYAYDKASRKLLQGVSLDFEKGKFYAILGGSGAGKSTLLGLLAGLDVPTSGRVLCDGKDIAEEGLSKHRKRNVSLVFQNYNLIDYLTPLENLRLVNHSADAGVLEAMGLERVGAHGTTAALALLNDAVKKGGLMACSHVGGLSGSFIPVSEDEDVRVLEILVLLDLLLYIALGVIRLDADAALLQKREDLLRVGIMLRSDRDDADLLRGEPEGKDTLEVFDDNADEALQGAVDRPVDDDRHCRYALRGLIAQTEIMRELEVELDGPALPFSPERVLDLEVDLRPVESPVSLIDFEASLAVLIREDPL